ncbi:MAG: hypothetical protein JXR37_33095 [Kiritimatiellae bacterium]|nr:hypothetical protein [Kiritimatiellia bacterium]
MKSDRAVTVVFVVLLSTWVCVAEDPMTPPGPPGSEAASMKTLNQVEPRTLIDAIPYTITNSGSYYLTRNLTTSAETNGIVIEADDVTLDLNGFILSGTPSAWCGIALGTQTNRNITIRNGVVRGWGQSGVSLQDGLNCRLAGITAFDNASLGGAGISVGEEWELEDCFAYKNLSIGIEVGDHSRARNCKARWNMGNGFHSGIGSILEKCVSVENANDGFFGQTLSAVLDCVSIGNTNNGIYLGPNSIAEGNLCGQNGGHGIMTGGGSRVARNLVSQSGGDGIQAGGGCRVDRNHVTGNGGAGVAAGWWTRVDGNHAYDNGIGFRADDGSRANLFVGNSAAANETNYVTSADANFGDIVLTNTLGTNFYFSNPWGNFDLQE